MATNKRFDVFASAARTATPTSTVYSNPTYKGVVVVIDATASSATPSVVFTIVGYDRVSGKTYTILASSAVTGVSTTVLKVYPGITASANAAVSDVLPSEWQVTAVHADGDSITYTVSAHLCV